MKIKTFASLFSGIGGFDLPATWMDWEIVFQVEKDEKARMVLAKNFPNVKKYKAIEDFDGTPYRHQIDLLASGFPCQPFSIAGKRLGKDDPRYLWDENLRVICEVEPAIILIENVSGLVSMADGETLQKILLDLESCSYAVQPFIIPAASVGAWHRRKRIWIIAYRNDILHPAKLEHRGNKQEKEGIKEKKKQHTGSNKNGQRVRAELTSSSKINAYATGNRLQEPGQSRFSKREKENDRRQRIGIVRDATWSAEPGIPRMVYGIPGGVDRISQLGLAVVPPLVHIIYQLIEKDLTR